MTFIDFFPNAERTLTTIESMMITPKEYTKLKEISKIIKEYVEQSIEGNINESGFTRYYLEYVIRNSQYNNMSIAKKEIIIANAILPNDHEIADLLNTNGFTIEELKQIMRFRSLLKNITLNNVPINSEQKEQFKTYKETITRLIEPFKLKYGLNDQTIILNRICEMLITCPELFERKPNLKKR